MTRGSLRLTEADRQHLAVTAAVLGVEVSQTAISELARFADILDLWGRKMNLVSCSSSRELVDRHLLDSLAVNALISDSGLVVDLGSGAGFPGIPLSIIRPQQSIVLVEVRQKRTSFLAEVKRTLSLSNVEIVTGRAETPPTCFVGRASVAVSRAVWPDETLVRVANGWLSKDGIILRMRSEAQVPLERPDDSFVLASSARYRIGSRVSRCIDVIRRQSPPYVGGNILDRP